MSPRFNIRIPNNVKYTDILEALKEIAEAALKHLVDSASSLKEVEEKLVKEVLPKLIATVKDLANKSNEAAKKVSLH